jgi:hypothetical protein
MDEGGSTGMQKDLKKYYLILSLFVFVGIAWLAIPILAEMIKYHRYYLKYESVKTGMTLSEVQMILGPGSEISEDFVTREHDYSKPRNANGLIRVRRVVNGDRFYFWENSNRRIEIGFEGGRVREKYYWEPSL